MDYRKLLRKYIAYVMQAEGVNFIDDLDRRYVSDVDFTKEDWIALEVEAFKARELLRDG